MVPPRSVKECLQRAGLGEQRLSFRGDHHSLGEFREFLAQNYPKLRETGGFELLRISGNTRSPWVMEGNPHRAAKLFIQRALQRCQHMEPLALTLSLLQSLETRHSDIIAFYKRPRVEWASPLTCRLIGDSAIGDGVKQHVLSTVMEALQSGFILDEGKRRVLLFEGERDHLTPSGSLDLVESDFFVTAGRMIGHCFLNEGPCLIGLSPAIIHVILGGNPEMATITHADCVDLDVRDVLELLEGTATLTDEQKARVDSICLPWDLPSVTSENRKWMTEKILLHTVLGRTTKQIKQLKKGLKDSGVWDLLSARPDTAMVMFPRTSEAALTPQMILDKITWPTSNDLDDDVSLEF
ncbi:hypothetical protein ACEWY4_018324 [Coilia grayii]|uniref:Uncharacterized protein n=1 Tax=Coilia grayii TaxID=363190 RepID=A0ABD1JKR6_9TELE